MIVRVTSLLNKGVGAIEIYIFDTNDKIYADKVEIIRNGSVEIKIVKSEKTEQNSVYYFTAYRIDCDRNKSMCKVFIR